MTFLIISLLLLAVQFFVHSEAMSFQVAGKRALVTGSSGGIGAGIAKKLASEGAHVLVHYNSRRDGAIETRDSIVKEGGTCAGIVQCDFRSPKAIKHLFKLVNTEIWSDGLDILINNAGMITKLAAEDDDDNLSTWHETMAVNLHAPLQLSRLAHIGMKKRGGGAIVNVSSIHGDRSVEFMTAYAASKAALNSLTRGLALEFAPDKVRVNAVAPGVVPVERTAEYFSNPANVDIWLSHLPTNRPGTISEIADATLPLVTNEWITGTIWTIDGGMMARSNMPIRPKPAAPSTSQQEASNVSDESRLE